MTDGLKLVFPGWIDRRIERLHRESLDIRESLQGMAGGGDRRRREKRENLENKLGLNQRLIAEYSQLGTRIAIGGDSLGLTAEIKRLEALEKKGDVRLLSIDRKKIGWFRSRIKSWFRDNRRQFPWRETTDPYKILIAEFFLVRTRADNVVPVYREFLTKYPDVKTLGGETIEGIKKTIAPLGLEFRAGQLQKTTSKILEKGGKIPDTEKELLDLPGVGRYTANAILATAFGRRRAVLDTNVVRILERFFGLRGRGEKSRDDYLWEAVSSIAPKNNLKEWNWALIDFGALVCTANNPKCRSCPLNKRCDYFNS